MVTDKQALKMYWRALRRNRRLQKRGKKSAKTLADLRTHNGKHLEPRWRTLWF